MSLNLWSGTLLMVVITFQAPTPHSSQNANTKIDLACNGRAHLSAQREKTLQGNQHILLLSPLVFLLPSLAHSKVPALRDRGGPPKPASARGSVEPRTPLGRRERPTVGTPALFPHPGLKGSVTGT
uniref:Uncharacterized protein n=1 Tax=Myotis myotis TaxID=51298 RepID=A0A7J7SC17_MYOMY|nr:hypothetical protein mMyoMyo1_009490 [Myotis myotis]